MTDASPPAPRRPEPRREISRRWFVVVSLGWLAVLLVSAWWGVARPQLTERDQTTVAQAQPYVDQAIARVAAALSADHGGVVAVSGFQPAGPCEITVFRRGQKYQRTLEAVVPPGSELSALERVAAALPASYKTVVRHGDAPRLTADAGYWVLLTAAVTAPGEIRFVANTGDCRPLGDLNPAGPDQAAAVDGVSAPLDLLHVGASATTAASVSCVDGGVIATVEATGRPYDGDLALALRDLQGVTDIVVSEHSLYAYRTAGTQVAVRAHQDATIVTATTLCAAR